MADSRTTPGALDLQTRLERLPLFRAFATLAVVLIGAALLTSNMQPSYLKTKLGKATNGYADAVGLDQNWALFAPEPRRFTLRVGARVTYSDGSQSIWRLPAGDNVTGAYWDYRWRKWTEYVADTSHKNLWQPAAAYVARQSARKGKAVRTVTLLRSDTPTNPPGQSKPSGRPTQTEYFTYQVPGAR